MELGVKRTARQKDPRMKPVLKVKISVKNRQPSVQCMGRSAEFSEESSSSDSGRGQRNACFVTGRRREGRFGGGVRDGRGGSEGPLVEKRCRKSNDYQLGDAERPKAKRKETPRKKGEKSLKKRGSAQEGGGEKRDPSVNSCDCVCRL